MNYCDVDVDFYFEDMRAEYCPVCGSSIDAILNTPTVVFHIDEDGRPDPDDTEEMPYVELACSKDNKHKIDHDKLEEFREMADDFLTQSSLSRYPFEWKGHYK